MSQQILEKITEKYLKKDIPVISPGDRVKVFVKIIEGGKERIQTYEGDIIRIKGAGIARTITVRRIFQGVGVERIFPIHSPLVDKIKVIKKGNVRRAKLYYLRGLTGKATRIKEKTRTVTHALSKTPTIATTVPKSQPIPVETQEEQVETGQKSNGV